MFHYNGIVKPGMIAMRGAWIGGGVEWNAGPQGHTVTILSPAMQGKKEFARFVRQARKFVGEDDFEMLETVLVFAEVGLAEEAAKLLKGVCVEAAPQDQVNSIPLYYLAYFAALQSGEQNEYRELCKKALPATPTP